jgi:hypothetical protein
MRAGNDAHPGEGICMNKSVLAGIAGVVIGIAVAYLLLDKIRPPAPPPPPPPPVAAVSCPGAGANDRCVEVAVVMVGGQPQIASIPDVAMPSQGVIFWVSSTTGWTFPADGIDFANPGTPPPGSPPKTVAPAGEFFNCGQMPPGNSRYKCNNKHGSNGTYAYKVTVVNGGTTLTLDPFVVNN